LIARKSSTANETTPLSGIVHLTDRSPGVEKHHADARLQNSSPETERFCPQPTPFRNSRKSAHLLRAISSSTACMIGI
jgi:hypothetical protein